MLQFAYVNKYQVGDRVEIPAAEELLSGYNDFHAANLEFYQGRMKSNNLDDFDGESAEADEAAEDSQAEKKVHDDVKAFEAVWGSMDFATATLVGLDIDWDSIQEKLIVEQEKQVRPADSALVPVGEQLRKVASVLAFSERIVSRLRGKAVDKQMITLVIQGFTALLQQVHDKNIEIPELEGAEAKKIAKLRTVDSILDYANGLFALGR